MCVCVCVRLSVCVCVRVHLFALPFELRKLVLLFSLPLVNVVVVQLLQNVFM